MVCSYGDEFKFLHELPSLKRISFVGNFDMNFDVATKFVEAFGSKLMQFELPCHFSKRKEDGSNPDPILLLPKLLSTIGKFAPNLTSVGLDYRFRNYYSQSYAQSDTFYTQYWSTVMKSQASRVETLWLDEKSSAALPVDAQKQLKNVTDLRVVIRKDLKDYLAVLPNPRNLKRFELHIINQQAMMFGKVIGYLETILSKCPNLEVIVVRGNRSGHMDDSIAGRLVTQHSKFFSGQQKHPSFRLLQTNLLQTWAGSFPALMFTELRKLHRMFWMEYGDERDDFRHGH